MPCPNRQPRSWAFAALILTVVAQTARADDRPLRQVIDAEIQAAWQREKVAPAKPASDSEFLRRVHLDLIGAVPTYEETVAFLEAKSADKREKLIDRLLADPRYARQQADVWDMVLFGRNPPGFETDRREGFQEWLRKQFAENIPYDAWARSLLKAEGDSVENAALYYAQYRNAPEDAGEAVTKTFLGVQLHCARCHDHPYEQWTQLDFYGVAAFFSRLEVVNVGKKGALNVYMIGERSTGDIQFTGPAKDQKPGKKGEPVKPKFLMGKPLDEPALPADFKEIKFAANKVPPRPKFSRKDSLADWITSADNPYFARAVANRVFAQYLGRGLVHPVDNLSPANSPTHPELLDRLTKELVAHKFDLKWYARELVNSKAYQLSSAGTGEPLPVWFQHARTRPLSAEELAEAWRTAAGVAAPESGGPGKKQDRFAPLTGGYVLSFFGNPNTGTGDFQGGLREHLYLNNGPLAQLISGGKLAAFVGDAKRPADERVERLFLSTLHRRPTPPEREKFAAFLAADKASAADAVWALVTCSEFRFNH